MNLLKIISSLFKKKPPNPSRCQQGRLMGEYAKLRNQEKSIRWHEESYRKVEGDEEIQDYYNRWQRSLAEKQETLDLINRLVGHFNYDPFFVDKISKMTYEEVVQYDIPEGASR